MDRVIIGQPKLIDNLDAYVILTSSIRREPQRRRACVIVELAIIAGPDYIVRTSGWREVLKDHLKLDRFIVVASFACCPVAGDLYDYRCDIFNHSNAYCSIKHVGDRAFIGHTELHLELTGNVKLVSRFSRLAIGIKTEVTLVTENPFPLDYIAVTFRVG